MVSSSASTPKQTFRCYPVTGHVGDLAEHARMTRPDIMPCSQNDWGWPIERTRCAGGARVLR